MNMSIGSMSTKVKDILYPSNKADRRTHESYIERDGWNELLDAETCGLHTICHCDTHLFQNSIPIAQVL